MTLQEWSDTFDTLLNSYNNQAIFGEQSSRADIVLDEYEKSVLLTLAQDIIVKQYFDRTLNQLGQGFDDSTRRQIDFSALITNKSIPVFSMNQGVYIVKYEDGNVMTIPLYNFIYSVATDYQEKFNRWNIVEGVYNVEYDGNVHYFTEVKYHDTYNWSNIITEEYGISNTAFKLTDNSRIISIEFRENNSDTYDPRGIVVHLPKDKPVLVILNESIVCNDNEGSVSGNKALNKHFVVVPINYREYDRQMSKSYTQPLKKQAWRLFNNGDEQTTKCEIIPISGYTVTEYRIRYVRRPRPIILTNLEADGLMIDNLTLPLNCELNPIIHMDILTKAIELAMSTRGGTPQLSKNSKEE